MKNIILLLLTFTISYCSYSQSDATDYIIKGNAKLKLKDYKGAMQDYNKAIDLDPEYKIAYFGRGTAKVKLKDYSGAIKDYNKAIDLDPEFKNAYYGRGIAKYRLKDINGACLDWSKAGELGLEKAYDRIKEYCN